MTRRKEYFSIRSDMFHYAASSDYDGGYIRSNNSHIVDGDVYSYATKVGMFDKGKEILLYTGHYYSHTTSNTLSELRRAFDHYQRLMVYDFSLSSAWERLKEEVKLHSKHPATRKTGKQFFVNTVDSFVNLVRFFGKNDKRMKSKTMQKATDIASKYLEEIEAKRKCQEEAWARRREKEEQERQARIDLTLSIVKEYMPSYNDEPHTFRECMHRQEVTIPVDWLKEHHQEIFNEENRDKIDHNKVIFERMWDSLSYNFTNEVVYRQNLHSAKILREISRYGGSCGYAPDILVYEKDTKFLKTNRHCEVDDKEGYCKKLLGLLLKAIEDGRDTSFVIGKHCGPYEIREYNASEKFLRVGCHCFLLENLREVYQDMLEV